MVKLHQTFFKSHGCTK